MPACSAICRTARLMDTALPPHSSRPSPTLCITIPWAEPSFSSERTPGSIATGGWYADSGTTQDGTGLTLNLGTGTSLDGKITRRDGSIVSLPNVSTPSYVDTNGNKITTDGTNYFDTLGATALTISGAAQSGFLHLSQQLRWQLCCHGQLRQLHHPDQFSMQRSRRVLNNWKSDKRHYSSRWHSVPVYLRADARVRCNPHHGPDCFSDAAEYRPNPVRVHRR